MPRLKTTASPIFDEWPQASVDPVVIFDTEFTAWPDSKTTNWSGENEWREIVQIGAVRIDPVSLQELGSFSMLALPMRNPILSDYFVKLTGIRQVDLDMAAKQYRQVLADFAKFVAIRDRHVLARKLPLQWHRVAICGSRAVLQCGPLAPQTYRPFEGRVRERRASRASRVPENLECAHWPWRCARDRCRHSSYTEACGATHAACRLRYSHG